MKDENENALWDIKRPTLDEAQSSISIGKPEVVGFGCSGGFKDESEVRLIGDICHAMAESGI